MSLRPSWGCALRKFKTFDCQNLLKMTAYSGGGQIRHGIRFKWYHAYEWSLDCQHILSFKVKCIYIYTCIINYVYVLAKSLGLIEGMTFKCL